MATAEPPATEDAQQDSGDGEQSSQATGWKSPALYVGIAVLVGFAFLVQLMVDRVASTSEQWTRLIYIYGTVEALVFAAAGAIFGTQVQRAQTEKAESRAKNEKKRADQHAGDASKGRALAKHLKSAGSRGVRTVDKTSSGGQPDLSELSALAESLFPDV